MIDRAAAMRGPGGCLPSCARKSRDAALPLAIRYLWLALAVGAPTLVPASPSIEAAATEQKHDYYDNEKSCHIHDRGSFVRTFGNLTQPTFG